MPTTTILVRVLAGAAGGLFLACSATISFDQDLLPALQELSPLPVKLSDELKGFTVYSDLEGNPTTYKVGKLLLRLFSEEAPAGSLGVVSSRLDASSSLGLMKWEATYRLTVSLQLAEDQHVIPGVGIGRSGAAFFPARGASTTAIQECALDIYNQVEAYLQAASALGGLGGPCLHTLPAASEP